jgi:hypothetical protein
MTDQYEPKGPFQADSIYIFDASGLTVANAYIASHADGADELTYIDPDFAARIAAALNAQDKTEALQAFKDYVHQRLDEAGIPTHPDGPHSKEGCRVGDRLDIALNASPVVTVKELEWRGPYSDGSEVAITPLGSWKIVPNPTCPDELRLEGCRGDHIGICERGRDAAKAACQADFARRVSECTTFTTREEVKREVIDGLIAKAEAAARTTSKAAGIPYDHTEGAQYAWWLRSQGSAS